MRKLLNTLYVTTPESYITKEGLNIIIKSKQKEKIRIPIVNIEKIVTFGYMGVSPGVIQLCDEFKVSLCFLSPNGKFIGRFTGSTHGNVILRVNQINKNNDPNFALALSKIIIAGKIYNYRAILQRAIRDYGTKEALINVSNSLQKRIRQINNIVDINSLRGLEGKAATEYFSIFNLLIRNTDFSFNGRNKRPPKDPVNTMLSFVYTLLATEVQSALETVGLDPYIGFLHTLRPGRASLALDLMEEFRAYLGDRLVLSLINRKQISIKDFIQQNENRVILSENGKRTILTQWQNKKKEFLTHPFSNKKIEIGLLPYIQAMLFARYLRSDIDNYPVFLIK